MTPDGKIGPGADLDPDIRRFRQRMAASYAAAPDLSKVTLAQARAICEHVRAPWTRGGPHMARTLDLTVAGVPIRIYHPIGIEEPMPALVYLHGGGWTFFSIQTHDRLMREYAARANVVVVGVGYSLSPEARFPKALEDIVAVAGWLRREGGACGIARDRIAIGGDSAGANLSVAANLMLKARDQPPFAAMLLNYGAYHPAPTPSYDRYGGPDYMLTPDEMQTFWRNYAGDRADHRNPLIAPLCADLRGLPPAFLAIAACDILADQNAAMAQALRAAGVALEERRYAGATHSFLEAVSIAALSRRALDDAAHWLRAQLTVP